MSSQTVPQHAGVAESWRMFDRIAARYDLLNRLLSFRQDQRWRRAMIAALPAGVSLRLLDLATGTGDVLLGLMNHKTSIARGVGLDKSRGMLEFGRRKFTESAVSQRAAFVEGDAVRLALRDDAFDVVTMAFGIRNVPDVPEALREMRRVVRPGGRALILEFSMPANALFRTVYLAYFRHVLPRIGALISGDGKAYRYLNESVETFPHGDAFIQLMRDAGFRRVSAKPMTFGIATLYRGDK